jgi:3',5'-cyclic AMP phosphodiesterase CpdA
VAPQGNPDFVIHTGDLVADGYDTFQWPNFFSIEKDLLRKTVFFPVLGNHERDNARFYEFFDVKTPYYSFDWGSAHFAIIDSDVSNVSSSKAARERFWADQTAWLEADLERSQKAAFRFVAMHHPPFTVNLSSAGHVSKETPTLEPLFERMKVTAVFAGHDHNYQHHVKNGVHYIVTGGGGAPLARAEAPLEGITVKVESVEHYVMVKVEGNKAYIEAVALDGHPIESIELAQ